MKREIRIFFTALMFYTRLPCPKWADHDPSYLRESARYFSLIGWIVGGIGALVYWVSQHFFSVEISIVLSIASTIRVTGAFHEDGFADVCDGFGGGWNKDKIIDIMKDSRLGTFGVSGLILILLLKYLALASMPLHFIPSAILFGHVVSRSLGTRMLLRGKYVQNNNRAKAGSAAQRLSWTSFSVNVITGSLAFLMMPHWLFLTVLAPLIILEQMAFNFYNKWIGGYNGDCIGALQQMAEVLIYLCFIVIWKYT